MRGNQGDLGRGVRGPGAARRSRGGSAALGPVLAALVCLGTAVGPAGEATAATPGPTPVMLLRDARLAESSALVASRRHPGLLWTVADSGNPAEVYGVRAGRVLAAARVAGAANVDWEALSPGPGDTLWVGDIGDNERRRAEVTLYEIPEPAVSGDSTVRGRLHRLRYADGAHDAEALLVHPRTGRVLVITKDLVGAGVYTARRLASRGVTTLHRVADAPALVTDAAWSPDGRRMALRTYTHAELLGVPGAAASSVALPLQRQGESLTWSPDGAALLVGSEGRDSAVWRVPVPAGAPARPAAATSAQPRSAGSATASPAASPTGVAPATGDANAQAGGFIAVAALVVGALWARRSLLRMQARRRARERDT